MTFTANDQQNKVLRIFHEGECTICGTPPLMTLGEYHKPQASLDCVECCAAGGFSRCIRCIIKLRFNPMTPGMAVEVANRTTWHQIKSGMTHISFASLSEVLEKWIDTNGINMYITVPTRTLAEAFAYFIEGLDGSKPRESRNSAMRQVTESFPSGKLR